MQKLIDQYFKVLQHLLTGLLVLLLIPVFLQVFSRFIPIIPRYLWTEELARFAFVWIILLGSSIAVRDQSHFHVDVLPRFSSSIEHILRLLLLGVMLLLAFVFAIGGYQFAHFGSTQHSEIAGLPMWTIYLAWPIAGFSWILFLTEQVYHHFLRNQKTNL